MPSLIDIRRRIRSVKNTQQITKAMKMVAAAKLRRAQERVIAARPYGNSLRDMLANIAAAAQSALDSGEGNPLLAARPENRIVILALTSDRGLAGAYSMNVIKAVQAFMAERPGAQFEIEAIGRKGRDYFRRRAKLSGEHLGVVDKAKHADAVRVVRPIVERFSNGEIDAVYAIGNEFRSVVSQKIVATKLLPVETPADAAPRQYLIEGSAEEILAALLPLYLETSILRLMLESAAAEHAARMTAMDAATSNAADVIERLTLNMNRIRQASITKEIIEVVSGAQAL